MAATALEGPTGSQATDAAANLANKFTDAGFPEIGDKLRRTSVLISDARERLRELVDDLDESDIPLLEASIAAC